MDFHILLGSGPDARITLLKVTALHGVDSGMKTDAGRLKSLEGTQYETLNLDRDRMSCKRVADHATSISKIVIFVICYLIPYRIPPIRNHSRVTSVIT